LEIDSLKDENENITKKYKQLKEYYQQLRDNYKKLKDSYKELENRYIHSRPYVTILKPWSETDVENFKKRLSS